MKIKDKFEKEYREFKSMAIKRHKINTVQIDKLLQSYISRLGDEVNSFKESEHSLQYNYESSIDSEKLDL